MTSTGSPGGWEPPLPDPRQGTDAPGGHRQRPPGHRPAARPGRGRPGHRQTDPAWWLDQAALAREQANDGWYGLLTNLDPAHVDAAEVLARYKGQEVVERRYGAFKGPLAVAALFVQSNRRIQALVTVICLALAGLRLIPASGHDPPVIPQPQPLPARLLELLDVDPPSPPINPRTRWTPPASPRHGWDQVAMDPAVAERLVHAYVEGWRTGDRAKILGTLAPDCVIVESYGPTYTGEDRIARWIDTWLGAGNTVDRWELTSLEVTAAGTACFFEWEFEC